MCSAYWLIAVSHKSLAFKNAFMLLTSEAECGITN